MTIRRRRRKTSRYPSLTKLKEARSKTLLEASPESYWYMGRPKFAADDVVGHWTIIGYMGRTAVNQRTSQMMSKEHHWYRCMCDCDERKVESRTQQELTDPRRSQCCVKCRNLNGEIVDED